MNHTHAKGGGERSLDSTVKSRNGWTDGGNCITSHANAFRNNIALLPVAVESQCIGLDIMSHRDNRCAVDSPYFLFLCHRDVGCVGHRVYWLCVV